MPIAPFLSGATGLSVPLWHQHPVRAPVQVRLLHSGPAPWESTVKRLDGGRSWLLAAASAVAGIHEPSTGKDSPLSVILPFEENR